MSAVLEQPAVRVRPMTEADLVTVMAIERAAYEFPWTEGIFRDCLRVGYCCWVLEEAGVLRGYGIMSVGGGEAHLLNLCIAPEVQRRGLGRRLLRHLLALARYHGASTVLLEVRKSNRRALRLYRGMGFREIGLRRDYYPAAQGREDALVLARRLAQAPPGGTGTTGA